MNTYQSANFKNILGYDNYAEAYASPQTIIDTALVSQAIIDATATNFARQLHFKPVTVDDMDTVFQYLKADEGRTTDFSYGGILMWVSLYDYQFAIVNDTLFIRGHVENDFSQYAFSLPLGKMDLSLSVAVLRKYCELNNLRLIFSAVPQYAVEDFRALNPEKIEMIGDMSDYLYSAEKLSTLSGKKYNKKRNHVNQFLAAYPDWKLIPLTPENAAECLAFMDSVDREGDDTPMAVIERRLNREVLTQIQEGATQYIGAILYGDDRMLGFTVGDIKGDTLYVHIEKALREAPGAFEMINKSFAQSVCERYPDIAYINREDDAGDPGLRLAKQSYHPVDILRKYNVIF